MLDGLLAAYGTIDGRPKTARHCKLILAFCLPFCFPAAVLASDGVPESISVSRLIEMLRESDPYVRQKALVGLTELGPLANMAVPALIDALHDADGKVAALAGKALVKVGPAAIPDVIKLLKSDSAASVRVDAAFVLARFRHENKAAAAALFEVFNDKDSKFKEKAMGALSWPPPVTRKALPKYMEVLQDKDSSVSLRSAAIFYLARYGSEAAEALPLIWEIWSDRNADPNASRGVAAAALVAISPHDPKLLQSFRSVLTDQSQGFRAREVAARCLGQLGGVAKVAVTDLSAVLQEKIHWQPADLERPIQQRYHGSFSLRSRCIESLARIDPDSKLAFQVVVDVANSHTNLRDNAIREIPKYVRFSDEAVVMLMGIIDNGSADLLLMQRGLKALGEMGPRATAAEPLLERLLNSPDLASDPFGARTSVLNVLQQLRTKE